MAHLTILSMARTATDFNFLVNFRPVIETSTIILMQNTQPFESLPSMQHQYVTLSTAFQGPTTYTETQLPAGNGDTTTVWYIHLSRALALVNCTPLQCFDLPRKKGYADLPCFRFCSLFSL